MESLTKGLKLRKSALKPIQITTTNNDDGGDMIASGEEQPLSPASRLFHEPTFNVYIIAIMGFKNPINPRVVAVVYDKLPQTLLKHPRFCSLQVADEKDGGIMKWVPTKVNLKNHIIIPNIPTQTLDSPDGFLHDYLFNLSKTSIDSSKPLWDLHLLNLKISDSAYSVGIFRIHHSLGDGTSLMSLLLACTRQTSDPDKLPTIPTKTKDSNHSGWFSSYGYSVGIGRWWLRWLMVVCTSLLLVWNTLVDVGYLLATAVFLKDTETPIKAPAGVESNPKRFAYRTVSLDDMKLIKNAMNTTINDVALGVTQAGLSQYLNRRYGEEKKDNGKTEKSNNLPTKIRLRSTLLINIRPSSGIQALADMMEKNTEAQWGNWVGHVILPLTIAIRDDPLHYVRQAEATIRRKKLSLEAICTFSLAGLLLKLFGVKAANIVSHKAAANTTLGFSNLVGPVEEIGFFGHAMDFLAPSCYGHPHGLMINFQSYGNKMTIVLSVDESTIPDPQKLLDDFEASLKLIKEAVYAKGLVKEEEEAGKLQAVFT